MSLDLGLSVLPKWYLQGAGDEDGFNLDGDVTLLADQVYRCIIGISDAEWCALQWQQPAAGTGTIASHEIVHTLENFRSRGAPDPATLGSNAIWAPTPYQFVTPGTTTVNLPAGSGSDASIILPIDQIQGTYLSVRFTVGGADCTGVRFLAQVRR